MSERDNAAKARPAAVTPQDEVELHLLRFADDGTVPNHPDLPVVSVVR